MVVARGAVEEPADAVDAAAAGEAARVVPVEVVALLEDRVAVRAGRARAALAVVEVASARAVTVKADAATVEASS